MLGVIAGYDELDPASADTPVPDYASAFKTSVSKLRLGMPRAPFFDAIEPEIASAVSGAVEVLGKLAVRSGRDFAAIIGHPLG